MCILVNTKEKGGNDNPHGGLQNSPDTGFNNARSVDPDIQRRSADHTIVSARQAGVALHEKGQRDHKSGLALLDMRGQSHRRRLEHPQPNRPSVPQPNQVRDGPSTWNVRFIATSQRPYRVFPPPRSRSRVGAHKQFAIAWPADVEPCLATLPVRAGQRFRALPSECGLIAVAPQG